MSRSFIRRPQLIVPKYACSASSSGTNGGMGDPRQGGGDETGDRVDCTSAGQCNYVPTRAPDSTETECWRTITNSGRVKCTNGSGSINACPQTENMAACAFLDSQKDAGCLDANSNVKSGVTPICTLPCAARTGALPAVDAYSSPSSSSSSAPPSPSPMPVRGVSVRWQTAYHRAPKSNCLYDSKTQKPEDASCGGAGALTYPVQWSALAAGDLDRVSAESMAAYLKSVAGDPGGATYGLGSDPADPAYNEAMSRWCATERDGGDEEAACPGNTAYAYSDSACSRFHTNKRCANWFSNVPKALQASWRDATAAIWCSRHPNSYECLCVNRGQSASYHSLKSGFPYNDGCWYKPCTGSSAAIFRPSDVDTTLSTDTKTGGMCPTSVCGVVSYSSGYQCALYTDNNVYMNC